MKKEKDMDKKELKEYREFLMRLLKDRETMKIKELADKYDISQPTVDKYLKIAREKEIAGEIQLEYGLEENNVTEIVKTDAEGKLHFSFQKLDTKPYVINLTDEKIERAKKLFDRYNAINKENVFDALLDMALSELSI